MTRMDRHNKRVVKQKKARVKWLLLLAFISSTLLFYHFGPDLISRFMQPARESERVNLVQNGRPQNLHMVMEEGLLFVPVEWVQEHFLPRSEVHETREKLIWSSAETEVTFKNQKVTERVNTWEYPLEINLLSKGETLYAPLVSLEPLLDIRTKWHDQTGLLVVDNLGITWQQGITLTETPLTSGTERRAAVLATLAADEPVRVLEVYEDHYRVLTLNGMVGYIPQSRVGGVKRFVGGGEKAVIPSAQGNKPASPFGLVWDYVAATHPTRHDEVTIDVLQVFSPTWFELKNQEGDLENRGQFRYAHTMRERGYQLWGLVTNAFDPDMTESFLQNPEGRQRFISQLLVYAGLYHLDGINIDFENIHYRNQDLFTDFVRELSEALREQNLIVSIDVTIPGGSLNWSQVYDRKAIEPHVDYFAVMTYDEHWGSSPVAGSVASFPWVERGIVATLEEVPPEKILLGIPLYTRLWEETPRTGGGVSVTSRAMGMQFIRRTLEDNGVTQDQWVWLEDIGQYYAEYEAEGKKYRVWLEDERSIALKATLIHKYNLAGFAAWRKDFEMPHIWDALENLEQE